MNLPIKDSILKIKVIPNASKTEIREISNDIIKIAIAAPPDTLESQRLSVPQKSTISVENKANKELIQFFKKELKLSIRIKSGLKAREKSVQIQ